MKPEQRTEIITLLELQGTEISENDLLEIFLNRWKTLKKESETKEKLVAYYLLKHNFVADDWKFSSAKFPSPCPVCLIKIHKDQDTAYCIHKEQKQANMHSSCYRDIIALS